MSKGKLIVLEGTDSCGKSTQLRLLIEKFEKENIPFIHMHFPKHEISFGKVVDAYLRGEYGKKEDLAPEFISMLYMTDFYNSKLEMEKILSEGTNILLSRYFSSTLTYQVALAPDSEKEELWKWIKSVCVRLPPPDAVLVLSVPPVLTEKLLDNAGRDEAYKKGATKDQHETDIDFQKRVFTEYERNISKSGWVRINCIENEALCAIEPIHEKIWSETKKILEK